MRAVFVLALMLSVSAPPVAWSAIVDTAPKPGASVTMGSATGAVAQLVRDAAKADKTFSSGALAVAECPAHHLPLADATLGATQPAAPPSLALDTPPLAPRPPPNC